MARIVVNKHYDNHEEIVADKFVNKGEIAVSNEVGEEGLYIINKEGGVVKIGTNEGYATEDFVKVAIAEAELNDKDIDLTPFALKSDVSAVSASVKSLKTEVELIKSAGLSKGDSNVQSDWDETDKSSDAFIKNKPKIPTGEDIKNIAAAEVGKIVSGAPATLDTLKEVAEWIENHENTAEITSNIAELQASAHSHSNAEVLDNIDSTKVESWDASEQNAKDYADNLLEAYRQEIATLLNQVKAKGDHVVLSYDAYKELIENGSVTFEGVTYEYNENVFYCIPETDNEENETEEAVSMEYDEESGILSIDGEGVSIDEETGILSIDSEKVSIDENNILNYN